MVVFCMGALACGRIGFDAIDDSGGNDGGQMLELSLTAGPRFGGAEGEIKLQYVLPEVLGKAVNFEIRRIGTDQPPADCSKGDLIYESTAMDAGAWFYDTVPDLWNRLHSYRACLFDSDKVVLADAVATAARFANPGPGCMQPPCAPVNSTSSSTSFVHAPTELAATGTSAGDIALADVNRDGRVDVIVASNGENTLQINIGDGDFAAPTSLSTRSLDSRAIATGDFNNDGLIDIVFGNNASPSYIQIGQADGSFDAGKQIYLDSFNVYDIAAANIDGDTTLDLVVTRFGEPDHLYLGNGDGSFDFLRVLKVTTDNNTCVNCVQFQDVNHDFIPDLIVAYNTGVNRVEVSLGVGDGSFAAPMPVDYGSLKPITVKLADLNNDGDVDLIIGRSLGGDIHVSLGDGSGKYPPLVRLNTSNTSRTYGIGVADFSGDGNADIVFSQDNNGLIGYLEGNGDGSFQAQIEVDSGNTYTTTSIEVGDINGDGTIDFVMGSTAASHYFLRI